MNRIKFNPSSMKLVVFLAIVLIVFIPYFAIIKPALDNTKELKITEEELSERVEYLNNLKEKYDYLSSETETIEHDRDRIISNYPNGLRQANTIAFLMDAEERFGLPIKAESFEGYSESVISEGKMGPDGKKSGDLTAISTYVTVSFEGDYTAVKNMLNYLNTNKDKMTLYEVNMDYDDVTGLVGGDFKLYQYAFMGSDRGTLKKPALPGIERGTESVFDQNYITEIPTEAEETEEE